MTCNRAGLRMDPGTSLPRALAAAGGWLTLGDPRQAWAELDTLDPGMGGLPDVLALRARIYLALGRAEDAATVASGLCAREPARGEFFLLAAQAWEAAGQWDDALAYLEAAPACLLQDGRYHLRLASALCRTGRVEDAREHVGRAVRLDPGLKLEAMDDPALHEVW